ASRMLRRAARSCSDGMAPPGRCVRLQAACGWDGWGAWAAAGSANRSAAQIALMRMSPPCVTSKHVIIASCPKDWREFDVIARGAGGGLDNRWYVPYMFQ